MSTTDPAQSLPQRRPKRADARRNYDKVVEAARAAFTERGTSTSLEEVARRAGVGIGTVYRNFPNRQALLEAVYIDELEALCSSVSELDGLDAWEALSRWLHRLVGYMVTKQALAQELLDYVDRDAPLFMQCRAVLYDAAAPLLERAQRDGAVRADTDLAEVIQLFGQLAKIPSADPAQLDHMVDIALDGLRYTGAPARA